MKLNFSKLSHWQQTAFCAALLERMLPNYQLFSESVSFGDVKVLRNQLDMIWQKLASPQNTKISIEAQLTKLELQTPDPEEFEFFGVFPALDCCMAIMSLWQLMQTKPQDDTAEDIESVSRLSENTVSGYVELLLGESSDDDVSMDDILAHPLMTWEQETQQELFDFIQFAATSKRSCQLAKEMALGEGMSSLGIELI
jgi:uncharacterized protein YjaG (DUF416 family)